MLEAIVALRAEVLGAIRAYFAEAGFLEVETPILARGVAQEAQIEHFSVRSLDAEGQAAPYYLVASPEMHMKRLLGAGCKRIFQLARAFRREEQTVLHNPEFTLLEWYRVGADYEQIMDDTEALVYSVARQVIGDELPDGLCLRRPWRRLTVRRAFEQIAGVEWADPGQGDAFRRSAQAAGCHSVVDADDWEAVFYKVLIDRVEPGLFSLGPVFLTEYPASMASLARLKASDPRWAERAELYIGGIELANGFSELTDAHEQARRFAAERRRVLAAGRVPAAVDERFLSMLDAGMPPAAGMALGVDRLLMLLTGAATIDEVIAFPHERA